MVVRIRVGNVYLTLLLTFCFVCVPAPGHSTIISSLASVFVAKAKATPENVVPYDLSADVGSGYRAQSYKVDSDNQLSLTPLTALHFCSSI